MEGFGQRGGERAFSAKFFGAWLDDGAFFVNETTLTARDGRGRPIGIGTVIDASALGVASTGVPARVRGMSATWKGMMIRVDVSDAVTRGQFLRGNATLVVGDLNDPDVDVACGDNDIQVRFVGADHAGVVGVFERSEVVGSFGGNRQADE